jgi:hypothetical protein
MKRNLLKALVAVSMAVVFFSCNDDKDNPIPVDDQEYKFIRVLVNDELTNELSLVDPVKLTVEKFSTSHPKSALYGTQAGRFGALVNGANNVKGTPKFAAITSTNKTPVHFKSKGDEVLVFNDGEGTLSTGKETDFHEPGARLQTINFGAHPHHGAMTKFDNGSYAVTVKDGSVSGTLPERVKIINSSGSTVHESTIQTKGIHGNATNGTVSLFGSSSGILVIDQNGGQRLISHPADFETAWFGTILEAKSAGKFIGYTAAKGAYIIDIAGNTVTPIIASTDIMQAKIDYAGKELLILLHSGEVRIYDLSTNSLKISGNVVTTTAKDETQKPQLEATGRYLYITQPKSGELLQIQKTNLSKVNKIKVSATPYRLSILGVESSEGH